MIRLGLLLLTTSTVTLKTLPTMNEFPRVANTVTNQVAGNFYRPDLKLSIVHRSLRVAKSGAKKRNRQAVKTSDFSHLTGEISRFTEQQTFLVAVAAAYESERLLGSRLGQRQSHIWR
ncbi:hypothetical protein DVH24_010745 [Malus domestica]|uniref:Uncharacterized protein n=1 Tax=Malus domestica TaxID=3750 RepID=A0A498JSK6_MALDO|nr:hypothetical protein DVH24_010745 [Malus domestica]